MNMKEESENFDPLVLRVRGLPWSASKDDIVNFFQGCKLKNGHSGIHMTVSREGRPSGEAYVEFETPDDADKGLDKNNEHLGSRYIEVFRSKENEMEWVLKKCGLDGEEAFGDACVRLRGLPFGCSKEEIAQFFSGLEIVRNGITLPTDLQGRSTGEAYVQFASQDIAEKAMGKHKEKIGHRYIEIFKSSLQEIRTAMGGGPMRMGRSMGPSARMNPYERPERPGSFGRGSRGRGGPSGPSYGDRGGNFPPAERIRDTGHNVHLRGLPFRAVERDIFEFFAPVKPIAVRIKYEPNGRSSGEADAMFTTHQDAVKAMKKDKEKIQHRYIELFLQSEPEPFMPGGPYGSIPSGNFNRSSGYMSDGDGGYNGGGPDRGFSMGRDSYSGPSSGSGRGFSGEGGRGFNSGYGGGTPGRSGFGGAGGRDFGFSQDIAYDHDSNDRAYSGGERGFSGGYGRDGLERSGGFGGSSSSRSFGGGERFSGSDRSGFGMNSEGGYRNGGPGGSMTSSSMRSDNIGYGSDRTNESDFYGSGKLFGGNFQSPSGQNMMPTTYPGY